LILVRGQAGNVNRFTFDKNRRNPDEENFLSRKETRLNSAILERKTISRLSLESVILHTEIYVYKKEFFTYQRKEREILNSSAEKKIKKKKKT